MLSNELFSVISSQSDRKHIILFSIVTFFFWASLYLYIPILPVYAQSIGASLSMVGIIVAAYAIPQMLFRIPIGVLFDIITRRKFLIAGGIMMSSVGAMGLCLAPSALLLFFARGITGIGAAAWVTFTVYFAAYYPQKSIRRAIGIINFVQGTALVTATYCGGVVAETHGYSFTFFGAALLGAIALIALLATKEPFIKPIKQDFWQSFTGIAVRPLLILVSFMGILSQFANWAGLFGFIPVYGAQIGASSTDLGTIIMIALASSAVAALTVVQLAKRCGNSFTIFLGAILMGGAILIVPAIRQVSLLEVSMVIYGLGRGILATILMSLSIQAISPRQRATAMGIYQATYAVGMFLGPFVSGYVADNFGIINVFYLSALFCLIIASMAYLPIIKKQ